jgi:hypothetical protein
MNLKIKFLTSSSFISGAEKRFFLLHTLGIENNNGCKSSIVFLNETQDGQKYKYKTIKYRPINAMNHYYNFEINNGSFVSQDKLTTNGPILPNGPEVEIQKDENLNLSSTLKISLINESLISGELKHESEILNINIDNFPKEEKIITFNGDMNVFFNLELSSVSESEDMEKIKIFISQWKENLSKLYLNKNFKK